MSSKALLFLSVAMTAWVIALPLRANYLTNTDLAVDLAGWHGDGERVFLKADGSEGTEIDSDTTPVIKLMLTHGQTRSVSQEIDLRDKPAGLHVQVEMYASNDFKRSKFQNDYTFLENYKRMWEYSFGAVDADLWIRLGPALQYYGWLYTTTDAKPGNWVTAKAVWNGAEKPGEHFTVSFCVPPGEGAVYLKNPSVDK